MAQRSREAEAEETGVVRVYLGIRSYFEACEREGKWRLDLEEGLIDEAAEECHQREKGGTHQKGSIDTAQGRGGKGREGKKGNEGREVIPEEEELQTLEKGLQHWVLKNLFVQ